MTVRVEVAQKTVQILTAGRSIGAILRHSTQTNVAVPVRPMSLSATLRVACSAIMAL